MHQTIHSKSVGTAAQRRTSTKCCASQSRTQNAIPALEFQVHSATGAAKNFAASNVLEYSKKSCWQSFANITETLTLALYVLHSAFDCVIVCGGRVC